MERYVYFDLRNFKSFLWILGKFKINFGITIYWTNISLYAIQGVLFAFCYFPLLNILSKSPSHDQNLRCCCSINNFRTVRFQPECPRDGNYTKWTPWSKCSVTCGNGIQKRERTCSNPPPAGSGIDCSGLGPASQTKSCSKVRGRISNG